MGEQVVIGLDCEAADDELVNEEKGNWDTTNLTCLETYILEFEGSR